MVAIHNRRPMLMNLHIYFGCLYRTPKRSHHQPFSVYELQKAKERHHIVEGLMKALSILDEVIATIRSSNDKRDAKNNLIENMNLQSRRLKRSFHCSYIV
jgi:topoisomerase-4 subunit A